MDYKEFLKKISIEKRKKKRYKKPFEATAPTFMKKRVIDFCEIQKEFDYLSRFFGPANANNKKAIDKCQEYYDCDGGGIEFQFKNYVLECGGQYIAMRCLKRKFTAIFSLVDPFNENTLGRELEGRTKARFGILFVFPYLRELYGAVYESH